MPNFTLPEPRPSKLNYVNAFAQGYAAPAQMQTPGLQNTLLEQKIVEEQNKQNALNAFRESGSTDDLLRANPEVAAKIEAVKNAKQKQLMDSIKPGLDYVYAVLGQATPENYAELRGNAIRISPALEALIPPNFDPNQNAMFKQNYEKMKRLEGYRVYDPSGESLGVSAQRPYQLREPRPTQDEIQARQIAVKQTPGASSGGGSGNRITTARMNEDEFQEYKKNNPGVTRTEYFNTIKPRLKEEAKQQARPNETFVEEIPTGPKMSDPVNRKITRRRAGESGAPVIQPKLPTKYGGKYYSVGDQHFQWDGTKYVPYTWQ